MAIVILISCKEEEIVEGISEPVPEEQNSWTMDERFLFDKQIQMNSFADSSNLYTIGNNTFSIISPFENSFGFDVEHFFLSFYYPNNYKMPVNSNLFVGSGATYIGFYPSQNPLRSFPLEMTNFDKIFATFNMPRLINGNGIVINDDMQVLIPYLQHDTTYKDAQVISSIPNFLSLKLEMHGDGDFIDTVSYDLFTIANGGYLISLHSFGNDFFISCSDQTYKLSPQLELKSVFPGTLFKIVKQEDTLYGFTNSEAFISTDNGESWQFTSNIDRSFRLSNFAIIDNEIIGFYNSQIFHLDIQSESARELLNDGLHGNQITSISHFLDKIYVTTLSGVYTRNYSEFFSYKTEDQLNAASSLSALGAN